MGEGTTSFSALLRQLRSAAALSQEELAERAGLSRRGISDLERGLSQAPRLETVRMLAGALALGEEARAALLAAARPAILQNGMANHARPVLHSVPTPLTRLIGRGGEVMTVRASLQDDAVRWLTLTGPGGVGKTRLAIEVAAGLHESFPDGVVFVDLTPLTDPALVMSTIAATLGVRESAERHLIETLSAFLASKRLLLVLDNCERILAVAPDLLDLLAASPGVTVLATSREPFHVRGEHEVPLAPLALPAPDRLGALEEVAANPALALFEERAAAVQPGFALSDENAPAITAICQRLDGLPLAIELAAARVKVLPPAALLTRLEQRLPLLTGGGRDLPARQRTMRDAIAWSYDLLTGEEQALFRRLAVFVGGFTLEAAEAVIGPDGEPPVLDGIVALVEQSLVRQTAGAHAEPRYLMLETVREFGVERLAASGDEGLARQKHASYFLSVSTALGSGVQMLQNQTTLTGVAAEQDNVLLAWAWFEACGDNDALLRLSAMLYGLWFQRGLYREARQRVEHALRQSPLGDSLARGQALVAAAMMAAFQGDLARADAYIDEGVTVARRLGDPVLTADALAYSAFVWYRRGAYARAEELLAEVRTVLPGGGNCDQGALMLQLPGDVALAQERYATAASQYQQAIACFQADGYSWGLTDAQAGLAGVQYCTGNRALAAALYAESLARAVDLNFTHLAASALLGFAGIAATTGCPEQGAHLLGAADAMLASLGAPVFPRDQPILRRAHSALTSALGEDHLTRARETGRTMSVAKAKELAEAVGHRSTIRGAP
jgi:predicted ATPase/DNA-binding XRE family transcriptional regulator